MKALGAFYLIDGDDRHEVWGTAWGFCVWVPMAGPFGGLDEEDVKEIEESILLSRP